MSFDLFGQTTKCDIKVGYISTDRGYVDNIGLYEANVEAKLNPGTQFIFTNRDKVEYLNINEVNKLVPADMLPDKFSATGGCSGIVGLNLEGDSKKSIDEAFDLTTPIVGGTTKDGASDARDKTAVDFYGGGGVGVQAAPIIGIDGSVLAVKVIHGGYGYQYPPIVDISDDTGQGSGAVAQAFIKTRSSDDAVLIEEFDAEEDYEEYDLETCAPEMIRENIGYGQRWDPDGKDLGKWDPNVYVSPTKNRVDPIRYEIEKYQKFLATLKDGVRIDGNRIKGWWTTRNRIPLRITSPDKVTREKFDVQHFAWGGLKSNSSPTLPLTSRGNSSKSTDFIESSFLVYTSGGQRRDLKFIFTSTVGNHSFVIKADDYKDNASAEEIKIKVARNVKYKVVTTSRKGIRDQGLLKKGTFGTGGDIAKRSGTSDAIFSDIAKTAPDDDDLQVRCKLGTFSINDGNIIFELKDNSTYNVLSVANEGVAVANSKDTKNSFMNQYAISPIPPSNVPGSDNAGKTYTFEWEEEFPYEGDYIFNIQCDNEARLFIGSDPISNDFHIGKGGAAGHVLSGPASIKRHMTAGFAKITLDLFNHHIKEMKKIQTDVVPTSDEVAFTVKTASLFAAGFEIQDLGIDISKEYGDGKDIKETITKKVEYGRVYGVKLRSSNQRASTSTTAKGIDFSGLNAANNPINVTNNGTRLALKDGDGSDTNASFTITNVTGGSAKFSTDGKNIDVKGDKVQITLSLSWSDNPRTAGTAVGTIKIGNKVWTQSGRSGNKSHTITLYGSSTVGGNNNSRIQLKTQGEKVLKMEDWTDESWDDVTCSVNNGRFYGISGNTCNFIVDAPIGNKGGSTQNQKGERAHVFNTIDYINKANRKLWKINSGVGKDASFINQFGVLPFDPTAVEKIEKKVTKDVTKESKAAVKFLKEADGRNYIKVTGIGKVKVFFEMNVNDRPGISSLALTEIKIKADDSNIILRRDPSRRYANEKASGEFTAGKKYLVKTIGASTGAGSIIGVDKTTIGYDDDITGGYDQNGLLKITAVTPINTIKKITETVMGYPDYPSASTEDYAGFHEIIWNNITFPEDGNYSISTMVDDNVVLTFSSKNNKDIVLEKEGFRIRGDGRTGKGKSIEIKYFKSGTYTLKAVLEQIPGAALANGNPMALAVDIKAAFLSDEIEVISSKSWNENPMGIAMTIDSPMAPKPKEPPQIQEGRCPKNPIWTTRSPADKSWYPVRVDMWSKFMNRYSISPLPPLGLKGTDGAGSVYRNSWKVELPYKGFYGVKGTVDNFGKLFIDGVEVLGPDADTKFDNPKNNAPKAKKIFLEKKTVEITVEVENDKQFIYNTIDKKVFSTADWASKQNNTSTTIENIDVGFKLNIGTLYAAGIKLSDGNTVVFENDKGYAEPSIIETHNKNIEVGKVYDVEFTSSNRRIIAGSSGIEFIGLNAANNPINVTNNGKRLALKDGDGTDTNASFTIESGDVKFSADGKSLVGSGSVKFTLSWNDRPRSAGVAVQRIKIGTTTWTQSGRSGSETHTVQIGASSAGGSNNSNIQLRNKGKNVIQMEDIPGDFSAGTGGTNDEAAWFKDIVCSATDGEFYNIQGRRCKYRISSKDKTTIVYGKGLTSGSSKGGVSYSGPPLATYATGTLGAFITPAFNGDEDYIANFNGKTWTMTWSGVDFYETGTYDIQAEADDLLLIKIDGTEVAKAEVGNGITKSQFNVTKGKRTLELTLTNIQLNAPFSSNPTVAAIKITKKAQVAKVDPRTGTALGKPWIVNPIGVSAILIPPPCPKKINGVGIVTAVIITDPGNGFPTDPTPPPGTPPAGPPVILELDEIIGPPGINYGPDDRVCVINTETGEEVCYVPPKDPTTGIPPFKPSETPLFRGDPGDPGPGGGPDGDPEDPDIVSDPGDPDIPASSTRSQRKPQNGFRTYPKVIVRTRTGIGYVPIPILRPVIDPIGVTDPDRLIQVTDLPGLKQTGYYDGRPYYGAVFFEDGIRYAGYYDTPGQKVQIYDTLQESIDSEVTTPPSAIQRQGTDINSNNPRLNIPGTPDNLT